MKRLLILFFLSLPLYLLSLQAQPASRELSVEHQNILTVQYGGLWQNDEYLSPLLYRGQMVGIYHEWWQGFRRYPDWHHVGKVAVLGAMTDNQRAIRNQQYALGIQGGWGAQYDFQQLIGLEHLHLFVGPYAHVDAMGRMIASYVNKPYSMDLSAELRLHAGVSYTFPCKRSTYRLQYTCMTDLIGAMFVPNYWQSYYELSESLQGTVVCSSLHNRQSISHCLSVDMQFRRSTWRIGIQHEYLQYTANNLHFSREQVSLVIGTVFNHRLLKTPL